MKKLRLSEIKWLVQHTTNKRQTCNQSLRLPDSDSSVPPLKQILASLPSLLPCFAYRRLSTPPVGVAGLDTSLSALVALAQKQCSSNYWYPSHTLFTSSWRSPTAGADRLPSLKHKHLCLSASGQSGAGCKCRGILIPRSNPQPMKGKSWLLAK